MPDHVGFLTENKQDYSTVINNILATMADSVVVTDINGDIHWVNAAFEHLTGYALDEVKNKNTRLFKSDKQQPEFYRLMWQSILAGNSWSGQLWNKKKSGELYFEEQLITPVTDSDGKIIFFISIKRNISEQQTIQDQLNMAKRIDAISQLTAGVAHNFNNKLASILGFADLALEDIKQYKNKDLEDSLNEIIIAGKMARDLVRQLMAFSVSEPSEPEQVDIKLVIDQVVKLITSTFPVGIKFIVDIKTVPLVIIDPVRLHQMLITLVANASDAMDGKGVITISVKEVSIQHGHCNSCHQSISGTFVCISVKDSGSGIRHEHIHDVFLPFYTTRQNEGKLGMGLSALHGILHDMHGHVQIDTLVDQHAEFNLLFPLTPGVEKIDHKKVNEGKEHHLHAEEFHILVLDDEESIAVFMTEFFKLKGYKVTKETSSKEALKKIKQSSKTFDLIITDQSMPDISGTELAKFVYDIRKDLPIVITTGYQEHDFASESQNIIAVLTKPFDTLGLLDLVEDILS